MIAMLDHQSVLKTILLFNHTVGYYPLLSLYPFVTIKTYLKPPRHGLFNHQSILPVLPVRPTCEVQGLRTASRQGINPVLLGTPRTDVRPH